ncbi:hypothetical protein BDW74DRAFT_179209 [Aspergillus multicolor]|uniref:uncharacterized protein n=1 Tax=Aspergillus multicolor TaxID=41759 RepID=UPI003CCCF937
MIINRLRSRIPLLLPRTLQFRRSYTPHPASPKVIAQGPSREQDPNHRNELLGQLKNIPKDTSKLLIADGTPSDAEWAILSDHFTGVQDLKLDSGWDQALNDRLMPEHWPLERLIVSGAYAELTRSPHLLHGRVKHLVLNYTCGLRFAGPTSKELCQEHVNKILSGEIPLKRLSSNSAGLHINTPDLAKEWARRRYNPPVPLDHQLGEESRLRTLEIIQHDALDTFQRMWMELPHVVKPVTSLTLHSTQIKHDSGWCNEAGLPLSLVEMKNLEMLDLAVGEVFDQPLALPALYAGFPPSLKPLSFRGPIALCRSAY